MMQKVFFIVGVVLVVTGIVFVVSRTVQPQSDQTILSINGVEIAVEVVDTDELRHRGLSGRASLDENAGMLFVFSVPGEYAFWMKDMLFPIDIVWIDAGKKIIAISENIAPETYPNTFFPSNSVQYVLETNAGWAARNGIEVGERVEF